MADFNSTFRVAFAQSKNKIERKKKPKRKRKNNKLCCRVFSSRLLKFRPLSLEKSTIKPLFARILKQVSVKKERDASTRTI